MEKEELITYLEEEERNLRDLKNLAKQMYLNEMQ